MYFEVYPRRHIQIEKGWVKPEPSRAKVAPKRISRLSVNYVVETYHRAMDSALVSDVECIGKVVTIQDTVSRLLRLAMLRSFPRASVMSATPGPVCWDGKHSAGSGDGPAHLQTAQRVPQNCCERFCTAPKSMTAS